MKFNRLLTLLTFVAIAANVGADAGASTPGKCTQDAGCNDGSCVDMTYDPQLNTTYGTCECPSNKAGDDCTYDRHSKKIGWYQLFSLVGVGGISNFILERYLPAIFQLVSCSILFFGLLGQYIYNFKVYFKAKQALKIQGEQQHDPKAIRMSISSTDTESSDSESSSYEYTDRVCCCCCLTDSNKWYILLIVAPFYQCLCLPCIATMAENTRVFYYSVLGTCIYLSGLIWSLVDLGLILSGNVADGNDLDLY